MIKTNKISIITLVAYTRFVFNRGINANKFKKDNMFHFKERGTTSKQLHEFISFYCTSKIH